MESVDNAKCAGLMNARSSQWIDNEHSQLYGFVPIKSTLPQNSVPAPGRPGIRMHAPKYITKLRVILLLARFGRPYGCGGTVKYTALSQDLVSRCHSRVTSESSWGSGAVKLRQRVRGLTHHACQFRHASMVFRNGLKVHVALGIELAFGVKQSEEVQVTARVVGKG